MLDLLAGIANVFGIILLFLYNNLWSNFGLAIIVLTILLKVVLLPLSIKSFNSMAKMNEMQPLMAELQRKYKNDKEALNRETIKLYQEKGANPLGGCLPVLIQLPIFIGLFWVMAQPLTYMFNYDNEFKNGLIVQEIHRTINEFNDKSVKEIVDMKQNLNQRIDKIGENFKSSTTGDFKNALKSELNDAKNTTVNDESKQMVDKAISKVNDYYLEVSIIKNQQDQQRIANLHRNMNFLGINLTDVPPNVLGAWPKKENAVLLIVPILMAISTYFSSKYSQMPAKEGVKNEQNEMQNAMQKQMMIMMPLMSGWFSFIVPVGLSLYWFVSNILQMIQQKILIDLYLRKKENIKEA